MNDPAPTRARQAVDLLVRNAAPAADPLAALRAAFERLAARCTETLAELAPVPIELTFREVVSRPMGDAQAGCGDASLVGAFQTPDKNTRVLVGADAALVNAALEAVLASDGSEPADAGRAPTRIGRRIAGTIFQHVVEALRPSLASGRSALELDTIDAADKLPAPGRRDEPACVATFALATLGRAGELFVIVPEAALAPVSSVAALAGSAPAVAVGDAGWSKRFEQEVQRTQVTLRAVLDEPELTLGEIAGLRVGQVLPLKATPRSNVKVVCNDQTMFWCELGQAEGIYTLRIKDFPDQERELIDAITSQ